MSMKITQEKHIIAITCDGITKASKKIKTTSCDNGKVDDEDEEDVLSEDVELSE